MNSKKNLHVTVFLSGLAGGGAQRRCLLLARGLAAHDCTVDVVVIRGEGPFRSLVPPDVSLIVLEPSAAKLPIVRNIKGLWVLSGIFALARYLVAAHPDVVLSTSIPANLTALWGRALARTCTPIVITSNLNLSAATAKWGKLVMKVLRKLISTTYHRAQAVIAISQGVAEDLLAVTKIPKERVYTIYNPVDLEFVIHQSHETINHPWVAIDAPPIILAVGKLKPQKDYLTLIRAFARVLAHRKAHLVILGEGEERARISHLVAELGIEAEVYMPGFVKNPFAWMSHASVFVLASAWEGFSNVLLEALACGCTIVSTDCPSGPREILDNGKFGKLVPVGNDLLLAEAILAALSAPTQRDKAVARAAEFSLDAAVQSYLSVLNHVCKHKLTN